MAASLGSLSREIEKLAELAERSGTQGRDRGPEADGRARARPAAIAEEARA